MAQAQLSPKVASKRERRGAFLLGTLAPSISEGQTFVGMIAGLVVMTVVWGWTPIAFTWYVFIGAATAVAVAWMSHLGGLLDAVRDGRG